MRRITIALALVLALALTLPAAAEVEEITVGGSIQVRGQVLTPGPNIEGFDEYEGDGTYWADDDNPNLDWITQRTRLNVDAKMSGGVRGFVELQAFDFWGVDNPRMDWWGGAWGDLFSWNSEADAEAGDILNGYDSDFLTGGSLAGQGNDPVQLYQAYIEMNDIADYPVRLRIGRQELALGREWLVGNNDAGVNFSGLAFDAIRLTYADDMFSVDAWWSKLMDFSTPSTLILAGGEVVQQDADIDFSGLYATYKGLENMEIDGYFLWIRDGQSDSEFLGAEDTKEVLNLYTVGARVAGSMDLEAGMLDYGLEGAMQFGDDNIEGTDNDSGEYGGWALNAMAGFTFATDYSPRIEAEYAYFSGDDKDDEDVDSFIRLFSDVHYGELNLGQNLDVAATNLHIFRLGASAKPCEKSTVRLDALYFMLAEDDEAGSGETFGFAQETSTYDDQVGWELDLAMDYQYTEDLLLTAGWAHFFTDDAFKNSYGEGINDDDIDYLYVQAQLTF